MSEIRLNGSVENERNQKKEKKNEKKKEKKKEERMLIEMFAERSIFMDEIDAKFGSGKKEIKRQQKINN